MGIKTYPLSQLIDTHQHKKVSANSREVIFYAKIPKPYVAFISAVACSWYPNTEVIIYIDGEEFDRLERAIPITQPYRLEPPVVCKHEIKVIAVNGDSEEHYFEFWVDGVGAEEEARVL